MNKRVCFYIFIILLSFLFFCVKAQKKQRLGFSLGLCQTFRKNTKVQEQSNLHLISPISASYSINWYAELSPRLYIEIGIRKTLLRVGSELTNPPSKITDVIFSRKITYGLAPTQLSINNTYDLYFTQKGNLSLLLVSGVSLSYKNKTTPESDHEELFITIPDLSPPEYNISYSLYKQQLKQINLLVNLGVESQLKISDTHTLALRLLYQLGLRQISQIDLNYTLNGFYYKNRSYLYGSNLSLELSYRIPFRKKRYQRKLQEKENQTFHL